MTNIPEEHLIRMKYAARVQHKDAAGRRQVRPEGMAILTADGNLHTGRSNEQVGRTAARDALQHLISAFSQAADPEAKRVVAVVLITKDIPSQHRPYAPTDACLADLRSYPEIGCDTIYVGAAHIDASYDLKL